MDEHGNILSAQTESAVPLKRPTTERLAGRELRQIDEEKLPPIPSDPFVFNFEIDMDGSGPLITSDDSAQIHARFRHHAEHAIKLGPGVEGALNLGMKVYRAGSPVQIFEDRMVVDPRPIEPGIWTSASLRIPRGVINFLDQFRLVTDIVKEGAYWFGTFGQPPHETQVSFVDGMPPATGAAEANFDAHGRHPAFSTSAWTASTDELKTGRSGDVNVHMVFDVSDLIQYFRDTRLPTGIQRVQIEIITNLIFSCPSDCSLKIACFTKETDSWIELPVLFFSHICKLALVHGDPLAPDWQRALEELRMHLEQAKRLEFARGAYLINLGTSWWLQNYFLNVRAAKARFGIRYVPYVHDCIPIMTPEHCVEGLTRDFITWALGAFRHADHIMVNSKATAADVKLVAKRLGHAIEEPEVVHLDGDYRAANARLAAGAAASGNTEIFLKNEIRHGEYVLFVSTIESRKNHLMAFSAWLNLVKQFGARRVPKLVCVGNRGWLNDAIFSKLSASRILQQKVVFLTGVSDPDLELLYRNCLFTLYPSSYEGWGLPVTESLCFGKVPVLSDSSSLPEAGGEFGEYFNLGSESGLLKTLERMIFDATYRAERERRIVERFRPRPWSAISEQVVSLIRDWAAVDLPVDRGRETFVESGLWPFPAELGRYYGLTENEHTHIWDGMVAGEMFRQGDGWWWTEPWGCWTKAKVARLAFFAPLSPDASAIVYVGIRGVQQVPCHATVTLEGVGRRRIPLQPEENRWIVFRIGEDVLRELPRSPEGLLFELMFSADQSADFRATTDGKDHRIASLGVCGFMVCAGNDFDSRLRFIESVALNDLASLVTGSNSGVSDVQ